MPGIQIRHDTLRSCVALVPVPQKPYGPQGMDCPTCRVIHPVKTVHLWLNDAGDCLVSEGVLAELQMAGMPQLSVVGSVAQPPPLNLSTGRDRRMIDADNRKIRIVGG